jgi:thiamine biosynthesis lipoprotein
MISESDAMRMTRRNFLVSTAAAMAWPMGPAAAGTVGIGGPAFGSTWRAALPDETDSVTVRKLVAAVVNEINQAMSPYLEQSELSVFNRTETVDWQNCSTPLADVAGHALEISRQTEGAFDPTIGPLVNRFGFGPIHGERVHPADLSVSSNGLRKRLPGLTLDLCGIAKGYALDRIIEALPAVGVDSVMFELGGEIRTLGRHPDGRAWQIGIERPDTKPGLVEHVVTPGPLALATSGTGRQTISLGESGVSPPDRSAVRPTGRRPAGICVGAGCIRDAR